MALTRDDDAFEHGLPSPSEGEFDAQLSLPIPSVRAPQPLQFIIKRDGRQEPFETRKIAEAILKAAQGVEDIEPQVALSLANGVAIYLAKRLENDTPKVDQVDDAVERALMELGHGGIALAYARYRDKRARIRRLREGDVRGFLREIEEARLETVPGEMSIYVRTSDERLTGWDRQQIVSALKRETELDEGTATLIAIEVERQVQSAKVKTLTASLVRELVDAKLIEFGLEDYRQRHMRLGVPLYDAEQIIGLPNRVDNWTRRDPLETDRLLAERVKREYALSQVFSRGVADAHLEGVIHIHKLGQVDRIASVRLSLDWLKRFGAMGCGKARNGAPARRPEEIIRQWVALTGAMQRYTSGVVAWDAFNLQLAPYVERIDLAVMHNLARYLFAELEQLDTSRVELGITWTVPARFAQRPAILPGGAEKSAGYPAWEHHAQVLAIAIVQVLAERAANGGTAAGPILALELAPVDLQAPGAVEFLRRACNAAVHHGPTRFCFTRNELAVSAAAPRDQSAVAQRVSLNLPGAALRAGCEEALWRELDTLLDRACKACEEKQAFLARLLSWKEAGPCGLLAAERDGSPFIDWTEALYVADITGLSECVQIVTGAGLHESSVARALGRRIVSHLSERCRETSDVRALRFVLGQSASPRVARRFARSGLQRDPGRLLDALGAGFSGQEPGYTPGARLPGARGVTPVERARIEGAFHTLAPCGAETSIPIPAGEFSTDSLVSLVKSVWRRTECAALSFVL